jgi:thioredoxin 1
MAKLEVIDFYAEWCGPCKAMGPVIEALALEYNVDGSDIEIRKANVDKEPELSQKYSVRSIPTLIFLKEGKQADKLVGLQTRDSIKNKINEVLVMV